MYSRYSLRYVRRNLTQAHDYPTTLIDSSQNLMAIELLLPRHGTFQIHYKKTQKHLSVQEDTNAIREIIGNKQILLSAPQIPTRIRTRRGQTKMFIGTSRRNTPTWCAL